MAQAKRALRWCIPTLAHVCYESMKWQEHTIDHLRNLGGLQIQGEDDAYDFGSGAGFYIDATKEPWTKGYNMYTYITQELPEALFSSFKELDGSRVSITGHSMGGHGALTLVGTI